MTDQELAATYVALLIIQWSGPSTPKAQDTINMLATVAIANQIVGQVGAGFALSTAYGQTVAIGAQLDILGQYVGAQRNLPNFPPSPFTFFGFEDTDVPYDPSIGGFGDTTIGEPDDFFASTISAPGSTTYVQTDAEMLALIQFLAAKNHMYLSVENIDNLLYAFFGNLATATESGPMEITYAIDISYMGTLYGILQYFKAFPHPAGVRIFD